MSAKSKPLSRSSRYSTLCGLCAYLICYTGDGSSWIKGLTLTTLRLFPMVCLPPAWRGSLLPWVLMTLLCRFCVCQVQTSNHLCLLHGATLWGIMPPYFYFEGEPLYLLIQSSTFTAHVCWVLQSSAWSLFRYAQRVLMTFPCRFEYLVGVVVPVLTAYVLWRSYCASLLRCLLPIVP